MPAGAAVEVECAGASTTSAGAWHLGTLAAADAGSEASEWLTAYLNAVDEAKASKPPALCERRPPTIRPPHAPWWGPWGRRVCLTPLLERPYAPSPRTPADRLVRAAAFRSLARYAGPAQAPFSTDVSAQREGKASPFRMDGVNVRSHDGTHFHDVAPVHLVSTASFEDVKAKMKLLTPRPPDPKEVSAWHISCFRPNVVVSGSQAWDEECWAEFTLGDLSFRKIKGTPRCTVPARHQRSGKFHFQSRPLLAPQQALKRFWPAKCVDPEWEEEWQGPIFGVHLGCDLPPAGQPRALRVGDMVKVARRLEAPPPTDTLASRLFGLAFRTERGWVVLAAVVALQIAVLVGWLLGAGPGSASPWTV